MERAVAYIRVSSQRQVEAGSSLDSQTKLVESYIALGKLDLVMVFREEGESAKTDQRPQLQAMLQFCRNPKNQIAVVLVPKIDRLARNVYDYMNLKVQFGRMGVRLESLGERIDDSPVGRFTEGVLASVAQFDNEIRAERTKGGMIEAVSQGRWVWQAPIGYRSVRHHGKGTIEPDPQMAPLIAEAFKLVAHGRQRSAAVRQLLHARGVTRTESSFYRMLQNEIYIGRIRAFGRVFRSKPPFVPLVDEDTFYKAQAALKCSNVPKRYETESRDFPLRGTVRCLCGRSLTASWSRGKLGVRYPYYHCRHCRRTRVRRELIDKDFKAFLSGFRGRTDAWEALKAALVGYHEQQEMTLHQRLRADSKRSRELEELRDAVALKNAAGIIPDDLARRQIDRLSQEIASLHGAERMARTHTCVEDLVDFAAKFFHDLHERWEDLATESKKDLLRFMFPEGVLYCPDLGIRTPENSHSERILRVVTGTKLHLVDLGLESSNPLQEWFEELYQIGNCEE